MILFTFSDSYDKPLFRCWRGSYTWLKNCILSLMTWNPLCGMRTVIIIQLWIHWPQATVWVTENPYLYVLCFRHSSDDDFEEVEFGSGSEPEVIIQNMTFSVLWNLSPCTTIIVATDETVAMLYTGLSLIFEVTRDIHKIARDSRTIVRRVMGRERGASSTSPCYLLATLVVW